MRTAVFALILLCGCPPADDDTVVPPLDIAGSYIVAGQILNNGCPPADGWGLWDDLFPWALETPGGQAVFQLELVQDGTALSSPILRDGVDTGCALDGSIGAAGNLHLSGPCDDDLIHRALDVTATATEFGSGHDLEGHMRIELDGGDLGPPDGTMDCAVEDLSLNGTGD